MLEKQSSKEPRSIVELPTRLRATSLNERYAQLQASLFLSEQEKKFLERAFRTQMEEERSLNPEKILPKRQELETTISDWELVEKTYAGKQILETHHRIEEALRISPAIADTPEYIRLQKQFENPEVQQDTKRVYAVLKEMEQRANRFPEIITEIPTTTDDREEMKGAKNDLIDLLLQYRVPKYTAKSFALGVYEYLTTHSPEILANAYFLFDEARRKGKELSYAEAIAKSSLFDELINQGVDISLAKEAVRDADKHTTAEDVIAILETKATIAQQSETEESITPTIAPPVPSRPSLIKKWGRKIAQGLAGIALFMGIKSSETQAPNISPQDSPISTQEKERRAYPNGLPENTRIADDGRVIVTVDSGTRAAEVMPEKADEAIRPKEQPGTPEQIASNATQEAPSARILSEKKTTADTIQPTNNAILEAKAEKSPTPERLATHVVVKGESFIGIRELFLKDETIRKEIIDWYRSQEKYTDASEATILSAWREQQLVDHNISRHTGGKLSYDGKNLYPGQQLEIHRDPTNGVSIAWHDQGELDTHTNALENTQAEAETENLSAEQLSFGGKTYTNNETVLVKDAKTKQWKQYQVRVNPDEPVAEGNIQLQGTMKTKTGKDRSYVYALSEKSAEKMKKGKIIDGLAIEFLPGDGYRVEFNGESGKGVIDALAALILDQDYQGDQRKAKEANAIANRVIAKERDIVDTGDYETTYSRVPNMIRQGDEAVFKKSGQGWQLESLNLQGKGK